MSDKTKELIATIEQFDDVPEVKNIAGLWNTLQMAKEFIGAAHEMYAPKWISVEDRLPDEAQVILVKDRIEMIFKATFIRGQFPLFDTHRCVSDVTHWMPASQLGDKE